MFAAEECSEEKKEKFRKYLEKHGVIKAFTDIFDKLMQCKERPENPIDFIRQELGENLIPEETFEDLERELGEAQREIIRLQKTIDELDMAENIENEIEDAGEDAGSSGPECL